ncbi:hypothetical protein BSNK01_06660 [Bacillaceae bacterium]
MRLLDRFILLIYSAILSLAFIVLMFVGFRVVPEETVHNLVAALYVQASFGLVLSAVSLLFLLAGFKMIFAVLRRSPKPPPVRQRTELGDIRISLETIENLAKKAALKVRGIQELKAQVKPLESGLFIALKVMVDGDTPIPELTERLQMNVKHHLETIAGIEVAEVTVHVDNVASATAARMLR